MARNTSRANQQWKTPDSIQWEHVQVELLMDLRDKLTAIHEELDRLNTLLHCRNFISIPARLGQIVANTNKRKRITKKA